MLGEQDLVQCMVELLDSPPWVRRCVRLALSSYVCACYCYARGVVVSFACVRLRVGSTIRYKKFIDNVWTDVAASDVPRLTKTEGQAWLCLFSILLSPECQKKLDITTHRQSQLLRLKRYFTDVLIDQLPPLGGATAARCRVTPLTMVAWLLCRFASFYRTTGHLQAT